MKINQVLLKFELLGEDRLPVAVNKHILKKNCTEVVTENQYNVLVFQFIHLTIKYFVKSSCGFIFLKKVNTISNYLNIETIVQFFADTYIQPYLLHSSITNIVLNSINYHWEISIPVRGNIKHSVFQHQYQRIADLETTERVCTKYKTDEQIVFTVYSQESLLKLTGCTKDINKISNLHQSILEILENGAH